MKKPKVRLARGKRGLDVPKEIDQLVTKVARTVLRLEKLGGNFELSVTYLDDQGLRDLNRTYRNIDRATDVLSFPMQSFANGKPPARLDTEMDPDTGRVFLGDIALSVERARSQAEAYGHSFERETAFLIAHSVLHLLGYDHEKNEAEQKRMEEKQEQALAMLGLAREPVPG